MNKNRKRCLIGIVSFLLVSAVNLVGGCSTISLSRLTEKEALCKIQYVCDASPRLEEFDLRLDELAGVACKFPSPFMAIVTNKTLNENIQLCALMALGRTKRKDLPPFFVKICDSGEISSNADASRISDSRIHAFEALGHYKNNQEAAECLLRSFSCDYEHRDYIVKAMGNNGDEVFVPTLLSCAASGHIKEPGVLEAICALRMIGTEKAHAGLVSLLGVDDSEVRDLAANELGGFTGNYSSVELLSFLYSTNIEIRCKAVYAFTSIP